MPWEVHRSESWSLSFLALLGALETRAVAFCHSQPRLNPRKSLSFAGPPCHQLTGGVGVAVLQGICDI